MPASAQHNRAFAYAALTSVALHALVLSLTAPASKEWRAPSFSGSAPIAVRMVEPAPQAEARAPERNRQGAKRAVAKAAQPAASIESQSAPAALESPAVSTEPTQPVAADSTSIAQYRQQLIGVAVRYKLYPPQAVQNAWEGGVAVRVSIAAGGALQVSVKTSSGYELLDEQALEMFRLAAPQVPVPPALRGQDFGFEVKAVYSLRDQ